MSKTVKSVYKFHDKNDDNAVSDESPESLEMNRDEKRSKHSLEKPSKVYKIVNKICRPVKARYARAKDNFLLDPSNTWRENSNGLSCCLLSEFNSSTVCSYTFFSLFFSATNCFL